MAAYQSGARITQGSHTYQVLSSQYLLHPVTPAEHRNQVIQNQNKFFRKTAVANPIGNGLAINPLPNTSFHVQPRPHLNLEQMYLIAAPVAVNNNPNYSTMRVIPQRHPFKIQSISKPTTAVQPNTSSVHVSGNRPIEPKTKPTGENIKNTLKIPVPKVAVDVRKRQKIGNLMTYLSESFLSWNIKGKTVLDLNFMRLLFNIKTVEVMLQKDEKYEDGICSAIKQIINNKLLSDWLILKCEEKEISFFKVNNQIEVYSVTNFATLLNIIAQESCLPLPFIVGDEDNSVKYFYINFPLMSNDKVKKLTTSVFYDVDNGTKRIPCRYPGIRLDCNFDKTFQRFIIHVHRSAVQAYEASVTYTLHLIIYNHIVWGFLQTWIRNLREQFNGCFLAEDIATNLSLCQGKPPPTKADEVDVAYPLEYSNFYLKFDLITLRETTTSFTIENFETNFVCDVTIVQYYRQFFLINDMHYSDALKNIVMFNQKYQKNFKKNAKNSESGTDPNQQDKEGAGSVASGSIRRVFSQAPPQDSTTKQPVTKPLIKALTVEEINSSVDKLKKVDDFPTEIELILNTTDSAKSSLSCLPSFISDALKHCYLKNSVDIRQEDETNDSKKISNIFQGALAKAMTETTTSDAFIESLYLSLQLHFTNTTCQNILNRLITKAIVRKFPYMKNWLNLSETDEAHANKNGESSAAATSTTEENSTRKTICCSSVDHPNGHLRPTNLGENANSSGSTLYNQREMEILKSYLIHPARQEESRPISEKNSSEILHNVGENGAEVVAEKDPNRTVETSKPKPTDPETNETNIPQRPKTTTASQKRDGPVNRTPKKRKSSPKQIKIQSKKGIVSEKKVATQLEPTYSLHGIPQMPPLVPFSELMTKKMDDTPAKNQSSYERREMAVQTDESSLSEAETEKVVKSTKDKKKKYNIKPCTIKLDRREVTNYFKRIQEKNSEKENSEYQIRSKKAKISDMLFMEARSRVLQRLRKRREMLISNGNSGRKVYTSDELEEFLVRRKCTLNMNSYKDYSDEEDYLENEEPLAGEPDRTKGSSEAEAAPEKESSEMEKSHEQRPPLKQLKIVLPRLEETIEFRKYRQLLLEGKEAASEEYQSDDECESRTVTYDLIPTEKRQYFEVREGNVYLKEQYEIRDGMIIKAEGKKAQHGLNVKKEPEEPEPLPTVIKTENLES